LSLVAACRPTPTTRIVDVGGGTSTLVDALLAGKFGNVGVLDISGTALRLAQERLGTDAGRVEWFTADVLQFASPHPWDIWHDRAVFHFLVTARDRAAYRQTLQRSLAAGGHAVISTFGPEGPTRCSGLDVVRYSPEELHAELGPAFSLIESQEEVHRTPGGKNQQFVYCRFRRS
jgi:SAM-dependent methyltransferase